MISSCSVKGVYPWDRLPDVHTAPNGLALDDDGWITFHILYAAVCEELLCPRLRGALRSPASKRCGQGHAARRDTQAATRPVNQDMLHVARFKQQHGQ